MSHPMTITEKILARGAGKKAVHPGENIWVTADCLMSHDVCGPGMIETFRTHFGRDARVWDPDRVVIIFDHFIFTRDEQSRRNMAKVRDFVREQGITHFYDVGEEFDGSCETLGDTYQGVCHATLAEQGYDLPGEIMFGTDSHTCTAGAFGTFSTGIGDQDGGLILGIGRLWVRVPETVRFVIDGTMPAYLMAKDIILHIIGDIGIGGATYKAMEFTGSGIEALSVDERMTITNMAVEAGAKNGIMKPNAETLDYLKALGRTDVTVVESDKGARYAKTYAYNVKEIEPVVARPHSPENATTAKELGDVRIDRAYIGSCTGGKLTDFIRAAEVLTGKKVKVDTFIVPATTAVSRALGETTVGGKTLEAIFKEAGCLGPFPPGCQACLGGPADTVGRTHAGEVVISTTNRNFIGRMGSKNAPIYLASPLTCAASAVRGRITDPREYIK